MKIIEIQGNKPLSGTIKVSGAKNSAVALIPAAILCDEEVVIENIPDISDTYDLFNILEVLNVKKEYDKPILKLDLRNIRNTIVDKDLSSKLRASYYFMGALLGKFKKAIVYFPGGCSIGSRPIDYHIKGFKQMGATVEIEDDKYTISAKNLHGADIYLDFESVGATVNLILAATKVEGTTIIHNAAREPEIVNVATFLNSMGAKITGAGTNEIKIVGVKYLKKGQVEVIPDRIETLTYLIIGALVGKNLKIDNIIPAHIQAPLSKLIDIGVDIKRNNNNIIISAKNDYKSTDIKTLVYPGFPTDVAQPFSVLLTQCKGISHVYETIYENRMGHMPYLNKMGANIQYSLKEAKIKGPTKLKGAEVTATDLRAGAALVCAGLKAEGKTVIFDAEHVLRGYGDLETKLTNVGAKITIKEIE